MTGQQPDDRVWIVTTWASVHAGAFVMPPARPDAMALVESVVTQQRLSPYPHAVVLAELLEPGPRRSRKTFDPNAPVEMLVSPATARAVALLAGAGLSPQVLSEYETNESETPR